MNGILVIAADVRFPEKIYPNRSFYATKLWTQNACRATSLTFLFNFLPYARTGKRDNCVLRL